MRPKRCALRLFAAHSRCSDLNQGSLHRIPTGYKCNALTAMLHRHVNFLSRAQSYPIVGPRRGSINEDNNPITHVDSFRVIPNTFPSRQSRGDPWTITHLRATGLCNCMRVASRHQTLCCCPQRLFRITASLRHCDASALGAASSPIGACLSSPLLAIGNLHE